jgi:hypothetical protein
MNTKELETDMLAILIGRTLRGEMSWKFIPSLTASGLKIKDDCYEYKSDILNIELRRVKNADGRIEGMFMSFEYESCCVIACDSDDPHIRALLDVLIATIQDSFEIKRVLKREDKILDIISRLHLRDDSEKSINTSIN